MNQNKVMNNKNNKTEKNMNSIRNVESQSSGLAAQQSTKLSSSTVTADKNNKTNNTSTGSKNAVATEKFGTKVVTSFDDFELQEELLRGIYAYGWESPSDIQSRAILPMLNGRDLIGQAQSGKGKTGTFVIASLDLIDLKVQQTQVLILAPTRELAKQIAGVANNLSEYMKGLVTCTLIGGTSVRDDIRTLRRGPQFVVGTPGRTLSHLDTGNLSLKGLRTLVLDEADEMLSRGFKDSMYDIFRFAPQDIQVCVFSATMKNDTVDICNKFMRENKLHILIKAENLTLDGIAQYYVDVERDDHKTECLEDLYGCLNLECCVIFCATQTRVEQLHKDLESKDFTCSCIHGGMEPSERALRMKQFRTGSSRVLISTDLLARGIDANVSLVINYDLPTDWENYIHRIGRSGRYGKKGVAINFVRGQNRDDMFHFHGIQKHYHTKIAELPGDLAEIY
eukprot:UN24515